MPIVDKMIVKSHASSWTVQSSFVCSMLHIVREKKCQKLFCNDWHATSHNFQQWQRESMNSFEGIWSGIEGYPKCFCEVSETLLFHVLDIFLTFICWYSVHMTRKYEWHYRGMYNHITGTLRMNYYVSDTG